MKLYLMARCFVTAAGWVDIVSERIRGDEV